MHKERNAISPISQEGEKGKRKPNENIPERNAFESWASAR